MQIMEFVGRKVKKEFDGFGVFTGVVQSYNESSKFFEIVYDDGDSEEMDLSEVASLLDNESEPVHSKPRLGRRPKKRPRLLDRKQRHGKFDETLDKQCCDVNANFVDLNRGNLRAGSDTVRNVELGCHQDVEGCRENGNLMVDVEVKEGFDLNAGFNFKLNDHHGFSFNLNDDDNVEVNENMMGLQKSDERQCIDLNLDAYGEMEENLETVETTRKKECGFDLNLGVDDESKDDRDGDGGVVRQLKESASLHMVEEIVANGQLKEVIVTQDFGPELVDIVQKEESVCVEDFKAGDDIDGVRLKEELTTLGIEVADGCGGEEGSSQKRVSSRRKRRKALDNVNSLNETVLRRSTRRGSARNNVLSSTSCVVNDISSSSAAGLLMEEVPVLSSGEQVEEPEILPLKLQLPPSSQNLDLDGMPVLDVFSIYACLRSFSTLLFLSPFELEDFVAALKCQSSNSLFDCIHVSILHTLRKHLEHLSKEGSESASNCLRSVNWSFLDSVTWPVFMVEYLLIHSSGLKAGFELSQLKLFKSEYYKQPVSVKVEMLRCLCDDMIEVESIRLELNRRSSVAEPDMDFDRNTNNEVGKKRRVVMDISVASCLTEEVVDDANDWNNDECCLCKMDGNLLCCDGCPAAYHSKCVGVANDLLPEGDWYCPECAIDRDKPWVKPSKLLRGAEQLGVDPHGCIYFSSCGYLLVSDSCDTGFTCSFYHRNDLHVVIDVLKSSDTFYGGIINAICQQWDITVGLNGVRSNLDSLNTLYSDMHMKAELPAISMPLASLASSGTHAVLSRTVNDGKPEETFVTGYSGHLDSEVPKSGSLLDPVTAMEVPNISSEGSAETTEMRASFQNSQKHGSNFSNRAAGFSNQSEVPGKSPTFGDSSMTSTSSDIKQKLKSSSRTSSVINARKGDRSQLQREIAYVNCYSFARTASSIAEELHKSPNESKELSIKSEEEIISIQMKAILKKWDKFCWPQDLKLDTQKEKCGWCFSCRAATDETDCLFNMNSGSDFGRLESDVVGLQSKRNKKGHLIDVICYILFIEDRLRGLLLGPWLNPHYSKLWRKNALKAADVASVKQLLLALESNLHHLAISAEWLKHVDSAVTIGSASHIVIASSRAKNGIRKRGRYLDCESKPSSNASGGLRIYWWRGGTVSCQLFNWKGLPRSLVSKAARQAGCMKIPGILYPESSDFAKRSRNVVWRAAVESSATVEQLALQVRELDANIRWNDIENTHPLCVMDKEFRKSSRLFKKAIVRRKIAKEGEVVKYLVDFGKRRSVPAIVVKHGSKVDDSSSEKKKYWLSESYVPLHLLKNFEERKLSRNASKTVSGKLLEAGKVIKKSSRKKGFSYLFLKAESSEYFQCGHCNKDVLIREAVCCQYCKGSFHKRHIKKSAGATISDCTYTCYRCQKGGFSETDTKTAKSNKLKGKISTRSSKVKSHKFKKTATGSRSVQLKNSKKSVQCRRRVQSQHDKKVAAVPLRRSTRKVKFVSVQNKNIGGRKKGKGKQKPKKKTSKKTKKDRKKDRKKVLKKGTSWRKKRTQACYSYWLNGLLLSRKQDDERVMQFRRNKFFASSAHLTIDLDQPKCCLCGESGCMSTSDYIACELCGDWYHGDAVGLNADNISKLIGFRCHVCRKRTSPVCPHGMSMDCDISNLVETQDNVKIGCTEEVCTPVLPQTKEKSEQKSHSIEDLHGLFPVDERHKVEQLCALSDTNQNGILESRSEEESLVSNEQNTDSTHILSKDSKPDILTACDENAMLEENTVRVLGDVTVTLHDQSQTPSCKVNGELMDTESALSGQHDKEKDGLMKKTAILSPLDSIEFPSQTCMSSDELLDEEKTA